MARRKKYRLITDSKEIYNITKRFSLNPRPRCGKCEGVTSPAKVDRGHLMIPRFIVVAQGCLKCGLLWPVKEKRVLEFDTEL